MSFISSTKTIWPGILISEFSKSAKDSTLNIDAPSPPPVPPPPPPFQRFQDLFLYW